MRKKTICLTASYIVSIVWIIFATQIKLQNNAFYLYFRGIYTKRLIVSIKMQPFVKSELYAEAVATPEDNTHYQELSMNGGGNPYLNTTLN